jgi:hypothetical membrane protein
MAIDYTRSPDAARSLAGTALVAAGAISLMSIITAEALYREEGYTTRASTISRLAQTTAEGTRVQPAAAIFNTAMILSGLLILAAAYGLHRGLGVNRLTRIVGLLGLGTMGVGLFPADIALVHRIAAGMTFLSGGLAGILAAGVTPKPFRYVSGTLGVIALVALDIVVFGETTPVRRFLGVGGAERWVAYPVIMWQMVFGAYLLGSRGAGPVRRMR